MSHFFLLLQIAIVTDMPKLSAVILFLIFGLPIILYSFLFLTNRHDPVKRRKALKSLLVFSLLALIYLIASYYDF